VSFAGTKEWSDSRYMCRAALGHSERADGVFLWLRSCDAISAAFGCVFDTVSRVNEAPLHYQSGEIFGRRYGLCAGSTLKRAARVGLLRGEDWLVSLWHASTWKERL
jgi:hypothetical protein